MTIDRNPHLNSTPSADYLGRTKQGNKVLRLLISDGDLSVQVLTLGAILHSARLRGVPGNLVLSSSNVSDYEASMQSYGSVIGPLANRLSGGKCLIDGQEYEFEKNLNNRHMLHSGCSGTHLKNWQVVEHSRSYVVLELRLPHGEGNFPGDRVVRVTYRVEQSGVLTQNITAHTTAATPINFTGHSYWNLGNTANIAGHELQVFADTFLPTTHEGLPTGEVASVKGTLFDFQKPRPILLDKPPLDHNFCLAKERGHLKPAARLTGSRVALLVETTEAGLQVYDARHSSTAGFAPFAGLALEAQGWPDAPNHPHFPNVILGAGKTYEQITVMTLSTV